MLTQMGSAALAYVLLCHCFEQKWLVSAELHNQHGCAERCKGLKYCAALPVPQISAF